MIMAKMAKITTARLLRIWTSHSPVWMDHYFVDGDDCQGTRVLLIHHSRVEERLVVLRLQTPTGTHRLYWYYRFLIVCTCPYSIVRSADWKWYRRCSGFD